MNEQSPIAFSATISESNSSELFLSDQSNSFPSASSSSSSSSSTTLRTETSTVPVQSSSSSPSSPSSSFSSTNMSIPRTLHPTLLTILIPKRKLLNGQEIPLLGLGTYTMRGDICTQAVKYAIQLGYRLIDTASVYRNEEDVAKGIQESGVPRDQIFITSKLKPHDHGKGKAREACLGSLKRLQINYIDLYLIHWPGVAGKAPTDPELTTIRKETWGELVKLAEEGYIKTLGVSNYMPHHLNEFLSRNSTTSTTTPPSSHTTNSTTTEKMINSVSDTPSTASSLSTSNPIYYPLVNQFELHPLLQQQATIDICKQHSIHVQSYATLARGSSELLSNPEIVRIATEHHLTPAQVCLRWAIQHGWSVIPKSTHTERIYENLYSLNGPDLTEKEMVILDNLEQTNGKSLRTCWDPTGIA